MCLQIINIISYSDWAYDNFSGSILNMKLHCNNSNLSSAARVNNRNGYFTSSCICFVRLVNINLVVRSRIADISRKYLILVRFRIQNIAGNGSITHVYIARAVLDYGADTICLTILVVKRIFTDLNYTWFLQVNVYCLLSLDVRHNFTSFVVARAAPHGAALRCAYLPRIGSLPTSFISFSATPSPPISRYGTYR